MISFPLLVALVATLIFLWRYRSRKDLERRMRGLKEIPGPKGYPLIGNILDVGPVDQHKTFSKFTEQFGDIYKLHLGPITSIVVSNPKMAKEMLQNDSNYVGRPIFPAINIYENEPVGLGIVNSSGELWEVHRRFLLRQLRDFGYGKASMEPLILEEVTETLRIFGKMEGTPITDLKKTLQLAVVNSLWIVVSQQRFRHDDPKLTTLVENVHKMTTQLFKKGALIIMVPWSRHIIPEWSGYNTVRRLIEENRSWFEEVVAEHKRTLQEDTTRDFIDAYLAEVKRTKDPNSVFYGDRAERNLVAILSDLLFAGSDTTSTTLTWASLYLCKYPETQEKFQEEIAMTTNGNSRSVQISDRPNMPYTLALIDEVLRLSSIVPDGVAHQALEDKAFHGYFIPKDAFIMVNMHHMHHNSKTWSEPNHFRPERFLDETEGTKTFKKSEKLFPFQMGRRQCVGEGLARDTVFLFLTHMFQNFSFTFDPNQPEPGMDAESNFILEPKPFSVLVKRRLDC